MLLAEHDTEIKKLQEANDAEGATALQEEFKSNMSAAHLPSSSAPQSLSKYGPRPVEFHLEGVRVLSMSRTTLVIEAKSLTRGACPNSIDFFSC